MKKKGRNKTIKLKKKSMWKEKQETNVCGNKGEAVERKILSNFLFLMHILLGALTKFFIILMPLITF